MKKQSSKKVAVAIDLGGTDLKAAIVDLSGKILHQNIVPSQSKLSLEKVFKNLVQTVQFEIDYATQRKMKVVGIGFGIPGILSPKKGIVYQSPHFPSWRNYSILNKLKKKFRFPLFIDNDCNLAALGEGWIGEGKYHPNFIFLTLGTGIGGAIVMNRQIFHGDSGFAGEMGHLVIDRHGLLCNCGGKGCLEMYASATGIFSNQQKRLTPQSFFELAQKKNKKALKLYEEFGNALGVGIASIVNVLGIETIIIGGGISAAWRFFIPSTLKLIARHTYRTTAKRIRLKRARLGNRAGMIGAARGVFLSYQLTADS